MKVKEFITMLLEFNMEADIIVGDNVDNVPKLSWASGADNGKSIEYSKRNTEAVYIDCENFPEEYENIFGKHNLTLPLTYEDVKKSLFGSEAEYVTKEDCCTSMMRTKIEAIIMLLNTAKLLNRNEDGTDWVPDFSDENNEFYTLGIDPDDNSIRIFEVNMQRVPTEIVYFRSVEIAKQVVQILGEDIIKTALTTKY